MRNLLGAILAISAVQASPHDNIDVRAAHLRSRSISGHNCVDFGTGGPNGYVSFGNVCVDVSSTSITVTYPTLPSGDSYSAAHLYLGTSAPTNSAPGQFPYNSYCTVSGTSASCTVPLSALKFSLTCSSTLYVAAQADVTGSVGAGTGWGGKQGTAGVTNIDASCNPNANCARYWSFSVSCQCPVVTTYEAATCTVS